MTVEFPINVFTFGREQQVKEFQITLGEIEGDINKHFKIKRERDDFSSALLESLALPLARLKRLALTLAFLGRLILFF